MDKYKGWFVGRAYFGRLVGFYFKSVVFPKLFLQMFFVMKNCMPSQDDVQTECKGKQNIQTNLTIGMS